MVRCRLGGGIGRARIVPGLLGKAAFVGEGAVDAARVAATEAVTAARCELLLNGPAAEEPIDAATFILGVAELVRLRLRRKYRYL